MQCMHMGLISNCMLFSWTVRVRSVSVEIYGCAQYLYIQCVGFCVHCGLSYISQILSELGTASNLKTVSGFLGCGKSVCVYVCDTFYLLFSFNWVDIIIVQFEQSILLI